MGHQTGGADKQSGRHVTPAVHGNYARQIISPMTALYIQSARALFGRRSAARLRRGGRV
jgi:hypothetical protein